MASKTNKQRVKQRKKKAYRSHQNVYLSQKKRKKKIEENGEDEK